MFAPQQSEHLAVEVSYPEACTDTGITTDDEPAGGQMEVSAHGGATGTVPKCGSRSQVKVTFTPAQEGELGEWYWDNLLLSNKGHRDYNDTAKKLAMYETKALSLQFRVC